jgi:hypothetical protein
MNLPDWSKAALGIPIHFNARMGRPMMHDESGPIRWYLATLMENSSNGNVRQVDVAAYTAADAITQLELVQRGHVPGWRVYRIEPLPKAKTT